MSDDLQKRVAELEQQVAVLKGRQYPFRGVRRRSSSTIGGIPLWEIAVGPDPDRGELRGHAKAIVAMGDMATGVLALGGLARGLVALGGLALGAISLGGLSIGALLAIGGLAIGGAAVGGGAVGGVAFGGGAAGYYACGGGALGEHVIDARRRDPQAVEFFRQLGLEGACTGRR
jgi:hypothetical protein